MPFLALDNIWPAVDPVYAKGSPSTKLFLSISRSASSRTILERRSVEVLKAATHAQHSCSTFQCNESSRTVRREDARSDAAFGWWWRGGYIPVWFLSLISLFHQCRYSYCFLGFKAFNLSNHFLRLRRKSSEKHNWVCKNTKTISYSLIFTMIVIIPLKQRGFWFQTKSPKIKNNEKQSNPTENPENVGCYSEEIITDNGILTKCDHLNSLLKVRMRQVVLYSERKPQSILSLALRCLSIDLVRFVLWL